MKFLICWKRRRQSQEICRALRDRSLPTVESAVGVRISTVKKLGSLVVVVVVVYGKKRSW